MLSYEQAVHEAAEIVIDANVTEEETMEEAVGDMVAAIFQRPVGGVRTDLSFAIAQLNERWAQEDR